MMSRPNKPLLQALFALLFALCLAGPGRAASEKSFIQVPDEAEAKTVAVDMGVRAQAVVRLLFVGDIMLDDGPGKAIAAGKDPFADFADEFRAADVRIGNLECPIATSGQPLANKIFTFRASPAVIDTLSGRFDALSVANNHSGDYGREAFLETLTLLDMAGIKPFGGGRNLSEAHAPYWVEKGGLKIAVLAYNEFKPRAFEAGPDWAGVAWSEDTHVLRDIQAARAAGADIVIPFMHWGWERERVPSERQKQLARLMIDNGADAVVGGHPHVTQGSDLYKGKPIIYSLGNFVFDGFELPAAREGWLLQMTVSSDGVRDWKLIPAYMDGEGLPRKLPPVPVAPAPASVPSTADIVSAPAPTPAATR